MCRAASPRLVKDVLVRASLGGNFCVDVGRTTPIRCE